MSIENILSQATAQAVNELYGLEVTPQNIAPQATRKEFEGNLTIVVFPFLRASHKTPDATAQEIGDYLAANCEAVEKFNVIKGFLNITIKPSFWAQLLDDICRDENYGFKQANDDSPLVMIEYSSPNTNKPLHLGHVRNNLLGYSLSQIMKACGNKVVKTNIVNDRGIHICKSMLAWLKWGNGATPESTGKKGDHLIGDFYVLFDKHYKAEIKEIAEAQGI
ncbi:MAG: arginine--tRNA ligase, partial [Muribaculaceae bacterium]|nr:arginine--tRNA ligase [Muribaculaceae bacterium]